MGTGIDAFVTIHPVGWPKKSSIFARFYRGSGAWELYEAGEITADHLGMPIGHLRFAPTHEGLGVRIVPVSGWQREYTMRANARLRASLKKTSTKLS